MFSFNSDYSVEVKNLTFYYPGLDGKPVPGMPPNLKDISFKLRPGSRCLLLGPNGAGKTTLLKLLGGKHFIPENSIRIMGESPFHNVFLTTSGDCSYIGGSWVRDIAFAGNNIPLEGDFPASQIIEGIHGIDPKRREKIMKVMDINPNWKMHLISDGQRRRVQICVGLLKPFKVLMLDEITVDLDVLGRSNLFKFLQEECEQRKATIIYATHIFDGLDSWPTHIGFMANGQFSKFGDLSIYPELKEIGLLELVVRFLKEEKKKWFKKNYKNPNVQYTQLSNNGWISGRISSSLK